MIEKCAKCSSEKVISQAKVIDRGDNNLAGDLRVAVDEKLDAFFSSNGLIQM